jgi:hypothetical protein
MVIPHKGIRPRGKVMNAIQYHLRKLGAPEDALKWASSHDNPLEAWTACPRGDWLLCLAVKLGVEHRVVVQAACICARLALPFTRDERPVSAILLTERWVLGHDDVTVEDVKDAARECDDAANDAGRFADSAGADVACAAMYAAIAALPGKPPRGAAAAAAGWAAEAAAAGAAPTPVEGDAARLFVQQACANIVRSKIDADTIMWLWWEHVQRDPQDRLGAQDQ